MVEPLPTGTVALLLLLVVLPAYFFAAGPVGYAVLPLLVGGLLAVLRPRWWWEPVKRVVWATESR
ncbi:hypothetical protein [Halosegnis marinus]|uniref:Uncharacterized protein n=1 Tax=Halosegnis marinus TaxID=3034023 RepID=A0ABD5ZPI7_9EURY|nr:hypothetical protein [Halosegnis sp. DT85]